MSDELATLGAGALAAHLRSKIGLGTWISVLSEESRLDAMLEEVQTALTASNTLINYIRLDGYPRPLVDAPRNQIVVVSGFQTLPDAEWEHLDQLRSPRLVREQPALLLMTPSDRERLMHFAPNMASFLGGQFFTFQEKAAELTEEEKATRLALLRTKFGQTEEQVIEMAVAHALPNEPGYAEWLVLLGRGDLLPR